MTPVSWRMEIDEKNGRDERNDSYKHKFDELNAEKERDQSLPCSIRKH